MIIMTIYDRWKTEEDTLSQDTDETISEEVDSEEETPKQNMTLDGFTTTKDLDLQLESILKSIEPEVMKTLKKTKYFDKKE